MSLIARRPKGDRSPAQDISCFLDHIAESLHGLLEALRLLHLLRDERL